MFDIGFWELAIIVVVGIVVVGPNRLPEVVRTIAIMLRKFRRMFTDVKADISRELDLDNMRKFMREAEIEDHIKQLNQSVIDMADDVDLTNPITEVKNSLESSRQSVKDIFNEPETPEKTNEIAKEKATEQADTGIEPPRPSRFATKPNHDTPSMLTDNASSSPNNSNSSDSQSS